MRGLDLSAIFNNALLAARHDPDGAAELILTEPTAEGKQGFANFEDAQVLIALMRRVRDEPKSGLRSR